MQPADVGVQQAVWSYAAPCGIIADMLNKSGVVVLTGVLLAALAAAGQAPEFTTDGKMKMPENYRQWIYLSSGFDISYNPSAQAADHHMFDNVFVNPEAYMVFVQTGQWPDKTMLVLEVRMARDKGSINQRRNYQSIETMGHEVHVRDDSRFPGKWAFFGFDNENTAKMIDTKASCYSCHAEHAAVDNTFVQFYPTLLPIAQAKGTLSPAYVKETASAKGK